MNHTSRTRKLKQRQNKEHQSLIDQAEGTWDQVSQVIGYAHTLIHQEGIPRIQTDIRITTR
jgi:uncharacterized protein YqgV (UPF0045/DUF77 family)